MISVVVDPMSINSPALLNARFTIGRELYRQQPSAPVGKCEPVRGGNLPSRLSINCVGRQKPLCAPKGDGVIWKRTRNFAGDMRDTFLLGRETIAQFASHRDGDCLNAKARDKLLKLLSKLLW